MLSHGQRQAPCPQCGQMAVLEPSNRWRPFCTRRCKLIDFGEWLRDDDESAEESPSYDKRADQDPN
nr:DNA gyrase inhibitor YacG [Oceanococcus sp. HetDA_MAG_MS8]